MQAFFSLGIFSALGYLYFYDWHIALPMTIWYICGRGLHIFQCHKTKWDELYGKEKEDR